jgi:beta-1,3-glucuronyltransferase
VSSLFTHIQLNLTQSDQLTVAVTPPAGMWQRKWAICLLILPCFLFVAIRGEYPASAVHYFMMLMLLFGFAVTERRRALIESAAANEMVTSSALHFEKSSFVPNSDGDDGFKNTSPPNQTTSTTSSSEKTIYVITPTYRRPTQMPDMTRLAQTLQLAAIKYGSIFWIVSEDATAPSEQVSQILERAGLPYAHVLGPRPVTHLDKRSGRGVSNRLRGLKWLRENFSNSMTQGVIYFADDDNSYDIRVFKEMKETNLVSVWPVGMIAKIGVSAPIVRNGQVIGFHDPFIARRKFAVDMGGFAVDLQLFLTRPKATMPYKVGYEEDMFLRSLGIRISELEPKAKNCTEVSPVLQIPSCSQFRPVVLRYSCGIRKRLLEFFHQFKTLKKKTHCPS